jgi:nucleotidyltransferase substrate binding protein (TIGR01987 family)
MIDISSLKKALQTLDTGLAALAATPEDKFIRDACIKRFEYSYETSHKMLRRYLAASEPAVHEMSFPSLIRLGYERGLLAQSWDVWMQFRDARNATIDAYDEAIAEELVGKIPAFAVAARFMFVQIEAQQL